MVQSDVPRTAAAINQLFREIRLATWVRPVYHAESRSRRALRNESYIENWGRYRL